MENKDVQAVLRLFGLDALHENSTMGYSSQSQATILDRQELVSRLMNVTLHCLGAIRKLVIEGEKVRIGKDCTDIDGTQRDSGEDCLLERQVFALAATTIVDTIVQGKELLYTDPTKDLIDSYPWAHSLTTPHWLMLDWVIMERNIRDSKTVGEHIEMTRQTLKYYPDSMAEVDKFGQHYMTYALRSQSLELLQELLHLHREGAVLPDGKGKRAIHYCAQFSQSVESLVVLANTAKKPLTQMLASQLDDYGNTALHYAAGGTCSIELLKEILFSCPEAARARNNDGLLPLHVAAGKAPLATVQILFTAFPTAIGITDRNHWLPIHHAAYDSRSVDVVQFLHEAYPQATSKPNGASGRIPIHYAAVKCLSSKVIDFLLRAHPDGAKTFDAHRRLPLHNCIARCEHMTPARLRCLRALLEAYPHAAGMADEEGRTPLDLARRDHQGALVLRLLLRADPAQDPEALAELTYRASRAKYRHRDDDDNDDDDEVDEKAQGARSSEEKDQGT